MTSLTKFLNQGAEAILSCAKKLNEEQVNLALNILYDCYKTKHKLIVSGVGKSGIVARKIAATFSSLSLTSIYLNPLDALHGDLGIIAEEDAVILLSNSGETIEILEILPHLKSRRNNIIAIVGNINSTLAKLSKTAIDASVDKEVCPLNLAPTASTSVAMAVGDAMAAAWMQMVGISENDFAINHPSGSLGKRLTLKTSDIMIPIKEIEPVLHSDNLQKIITKLTLGSEKRGALGATWIRSVEDPNKLDGLITDGDLRRVLQKFPENSWNKIVAKDLATRNPISISPQKQAIEALKLMEYNNKKKVYVLPVIENEKILGMVRMHDLIVAGI